MLIVCMYCICLPMGYLFGIHYELGLMGLWLGMVIGLIILASGYIYLGFFRFDWQKIAEEAEQRSNKELNGLQEVQLIEK